MPCHTSRINPFTSTLIASHPEDMINVSDMKFVKIIVLFAGKREGEGER